MISSALRSANILWDRLSQKERGAVLYDLGLIQDFSGNNPITTPAIEEFLLVGSELASTEKERFLKKITAIWEHQRFVRDKSMSFLGDTEEGFTDRVLVALGQSATPLKSRNISNLLFETGSAPKNTRNLLTQLRKTGAITTENPESDGEPLFKLTSEGKRRRDQLLGIE